MHRNLPFVGCLLLRCCWSSLSMSVFTVDQRQFAIVFQLGEIKEVIKEPGLDFKWPLIQNVRFFDKRILTLDSAEPERFLTAEKKPVLVDSFVKWRIVDVKQYYISVGGDETLAKTRLSQTVNSGLARGVRQAHGARCRLRRARQDHGRCAEEGRCRHARHRRRDRRCAPEARRPAAEVSESVYRRMETERKRVANELRSQGAAEAEKIRADADRQREVIVAEAYRDAQKIKGEGDAKAAAIYGQAFGQNPEFYAFYRSLEAYRQSFRNKSDVMVVEPNSDFFKYLKSGGKGSGK